MRLAGCLRKLLRSFGLEILSFIADRTELNGSEVVTVTEQCRRAQAYRCWCFNFGANRRSTDVDLGDGACQYPADLSSCHCSAGDYVMALS